MHQGQLRKSGDPYFIHPVGVADIIAQLRLDTASVCAALLHDVIEDTPATSEDLAREFGTFSGFYLFNYAANWAALPLFVEIGGIPPIVAQLGFTGRGGLSLCCHRPRCGFDRRARVSRPTRCGRPAGRRPAT